MFSLISIDAKRVGPLVVLMVAALALVLGVKYFNARKAADAANAQSATANAGVAADDNYTSFQNLLKSMAASASTATTSNGAVITAAPTASPPPAQAAPATANPSMLAATPPGTTT